MAKNRKKREKNKDICKIKNGTKQYKKKAAKKNNYYILYRCENRKNECGPLRDVTVQQQQQQHQQIWNKAQLYSRGDNNTKVKMIVEKFFYFLQWESLLLHKHNSKQQQKCKSCSNNEKKK